MSDEREAVSEVSPYQGGDRPNVLTPREHFLQTERKAQQFRDKHSILEVNQNRDVANGLLRRALKSHIEQGEVCTTLRFSRLSLIK